MRCECEVGRREGGSPVGGVGEREGVGVVSERRRDLASLVMRGCQYLLLRHLALLFWNHT